MPPSPPRLFANGRVREAPLPASVVRGESIAFHTGGVSDPDAGSRSGSERDGGAEIAPVDQEWALSCGSGGG